MMRKIFLTAITVFFVSGFMAGDLFAAFEAGVSITGEGVKGFYLSVGEYYGVPEKEVVKIKRKKIKDDEIPVVLFLAQRSGISSAKIMDMRLGGLTWFEVSVKIGVGADAFYVPVKEAKGPPYGKAYGYYAKKPKQDWKTIRLDDDEVVNFVNLKFISEHYGYSADDVIKMRGEGKSFIFINDEVKKGKGRGHGNEKEKGHGKGKVKWDRD